MPAPPPYIAKISHGNKHLGTGVLVSPTLILTCEHVVRQIGYGQHLKIRIDQRDLTGKVKTGTKDTKRDLAMIEIDALDLAPPPWSNEVRAGDQCSALGWPEDEYEAVRATVEGEHKRQVNFKPNVLGGSSGGALLRLIGHHDHCVGLLSLGGEGALISRAIGTAIVEEFLREHGVTLPTTPLPPPRCASPNTDKYFEDLRRETGEIDLDSLKVPREGRNAPRIDVLYIPLKTSHAPGGETEPGSATLESALGNPRLLIEGDAGSGKTTFLRRIAWALCRGRDDEETRLRLPIRGFPMYIRVSKLDRHI
ncbi:MAG: trypsin-like peptidase domain-containing protein, partial [Terriglobia bacterium]